MAEDPWKRSTGQKEAGKEALLPRMQMAAGSTPVRQSPSSNGPGTRGALSPCLASAAGAGTARGLNPSSLQWNCSLSSFILSFKASAVT